MSKIHLKNVDNSKDFQVHIIDNPIVSSQLNTPIPKNKPHFTNTLLIDGESIKTRDIAANKNRKQYKEMESYTR